MAGSVLGVDFGTSNSAVGIMRDGVPVLIEMEPGATTLPTAVFFDFDAQAMAVGQVANRALLDGVEGRFMRALKSLLGTALMHEKRMLLGERLDFIDITGRFLGELKRRAEAATGQQFDRALSGRPVQFHSSDAARNAQAEIDLRDAYLAAGFTDVRFMFEPEAAALTNRHLLPPQGLGLVVDIGGGTSDFTLFRQQGDRDVEILASHGIRLGGTDFDRAISVAQVMPQLGMGSQIRHAFGNDTHRAPNAIFNDLATWQKIPFLYGPDTKRAAAELARYAVQQKRFARLVRVLDEELGHDIAFAVEAGKIAANSGVHHPAIKMDMLRSGAKLPLPGAMMTQTLAELAAEIGVAAQATLSKAAVEPEAVRQLIFVGGSSLMQVVEDALRSEVPNAAVHRGAAMTAIVDGLAMAAEGAFAG